jgi:hypothetical protein
MAQEFRKREEEEELIRSFEEILKKKSSVFFDLEAYETIIYYYLDRAKHKKALTAVSMAMAQYPFSTELIAAKARDKAGDRRRSHRPACGDGRDQTARGLNPSRTKHRRKFP